MVLTKKQEETRIMGKEQKKISLTKNEVIYIVDVLCSFYKHESIRKVLRLIVNKIRIQKE